MICTFDDFQKIQIVCGTVLSVEKFDRAAKPAYKVQVNFGEKIGCLWTSAQVTTHYKPEKLIGKKLWVV